MRITLSIPDAVAEQFQAFVPARKRSRLVTKLIERELKKHEDKLASACHAANKDKYLEREIKEWQEFDDSLAE
ncbi:MAG: hypothetical protein R8M38_09955 [Mariprofundaceae bacterium]